MRDRSENFEIKVQAAMRAVRLGSPHTVQQWAEFDANSTAPSRFRIMQSSNACSSQEPWCVPDIPCGSVSGNAGNCVHIIGPELRV